MKARYWLARLTISTWALLLGLTLIAEIRGHSPVGPIDGGNMGHLAPFLLAALGAIAVLDCIVNDVLPEGFWLKTVHYRYIGFPAISGVLVLIAGAMAVNKTASLLLMLNFLAPAGFAFALTFLEIFARRSSRK